MKIAYVTLSGKSGGDVYFNQLQQTQKKMNNTTTQLSYHRMWSICPNLLSRFIKVGNSHDIIHSNIEYGFAFEAKKKPLIVSCLHIVTEEFLEKYYSVTQKLYYRRILQLIKHSIKRADYVIAISKSSQAQVKNIYDVKNIQTIYCGIDTQLFNPIRIENNLYPGKIKLLFVGNLTKRKGVDLLPQIMAKLDNRFILFYTTGMRTAKRVFSDNRMIPVGSLQLAELVYWYNLCDICLLPSRLEGFGYTVAEAMASQKPVVATDCSSLPEIVINGVNGFLCKIDDVADFVDKINLLADNKQMREEMGVRNRQRIVEHFNLEKMGREYNEMYHKVLKEFS
ncbi:MAG: glycosyltransferase family 4 protein [Candidatus Latescibacteria bacterium]|nr:glycosyltransferase family 4 protein [Candidatus Latescibacterota bacterium]